MWETIKSLLASIGAKTENGMVVTTNTPKIDTIMVIVRYMITMIGTFLVTKGVVDEQLWSTIGGTIMAIIPPIYGAIRTYNMKTGLVAAEFGASVTTK